MRDCVSIASILVNYRTEIDTKECVASIRANYPASLVVIVNNSFSVDKDTLLNILKTDYEEFDTSDIAIDNTFSVHTLKNQNHLCYLLNSLDNIGYGAAINLAADFLKSLDTINYCVILNNDTIITRGYLEPLVKKLASEENVACTTGKILKYDTKEIWYGGGEYNNLFMKIKHTEYNNECSVSFVCGCLMVVKLVDLVKYRFDEKFFLYYEDVDLCVRMRKAGKILYYVPESVIYHKVSQSTLAKSQQAYLYHFDGRCRFLVKHAGIIKLLLLSALDMSKFVLNPRIHARTKYLLGVRMIKMITEKLLISNG